MRVCLYLLLLISLASCDEKGLEVPIIIQESPTQLSLSNIHFYNADHGLIVGGDMWFKGICLTTHDGGQNWRLDSLTDKKILGLGATPDNSLISVGVSGYFFEKPDAGSEWQFHRLRDWGIIRDVAGINSGGYVCVGGAGLSTGFVYLLDAEFKTDTVFQFEQEFRSVVCIPDNTCFAVGFGHIIEINPMDQSFEFLSVEGDFFQDVQFVNSQTGFILGTTGLVFRTDNAGQDWKMVASGSTFSSSGDVFRAAFYIDENEGYRVGDNGLVQKTQDGASNWETISLDFEGQLNNVTVMGNQVYVISENGDIISFKHN
jgi:photosystem II stability/assembly factor-like uncharacterized protein